MKNIFYTHIFFYVNFENILTELIKKVSIHLFFFFKCQLFYVIQCENDYKYSNKVCLKNKLFYLNVLNNEFASIITLKSSFMPKFLLNFEELNVF